MEHPCDVCKYRDKSCPYDCIFDWHSGYCQNSECRFYNGDTMCEFAQKCGAYIGDGRQELDFDEDEEDAE